MSFWNALRSCNGPTHFAVFFRGNFAKAVTLGGRVDGVKLYTYACTNPNGYVLTDRKLDGRYRVIESKRVFVLAYDQDEITEVRFSELANYDYFLTSKLSGCRFVVTGTGVSHVSWSAGRPQDRWCGSQDMRDEAQADNMQKIPKNMRRLSITPGTSPLEATLSEEGTNIFPSASYDLQTERVLMFGYKNNNVWHFKMLTYQKGGSRKDGSWSKFVSVRVG
ncbi:hypothetical protein [Massilia sp. S19_KUP03_FR1]|uniref:hypothetical protein n=1 Tax=Massilia sp. S19_KUP03_FR1 TaxID=3025503 RepID=UPI002FCD713F